VARLTKDNVAKALAAHHGILSQAAQALGVSRVAIYKFIEKNPELNEVRAEATETLIDVAEGQLAKSLNDGDMKSVRWYLERQGKNRGYTTRVEQTGADGGAIESVQRVERVIVDPAGAGNDDA